MAKRNLKLLGALSDFMVFNAQILYKYFFYQIRYIFIDFLVSVYAFRLRRNHSLKQPLCPMKRRIELFKYISTAKENLLLVYIISR